MSDNAIAPLEDKPNPTYPVVLTSNSKVTVVSSNFHFIRYFPFASKTAECLYPLSWEKVRRTVEKKKAPRKANTNIILKCYRTKNINPNAEEKKFKCCSFQLHVCCFRVCIGNWWWAHRGYPDRQASHFPLPPTETVLTCVLALWSVEARPTRLSWSIYLYPVSVWKVAAVGYSPCDLTDWLYNSYTNLGPICCSLDERAVTAWSWLQCI